MPVELVEHLQGVGSFDLPFRRDPELEALLGEVTDGELRPDFRHIVVRRGGAVIFAGVIHTLDPQPGHVVARGGSLAWWAGVESEGPLVEFRRYCASNNKLSNPSFALGETYWDASEDSGWSVAGGVATHTGDYEGDDALAHEDTFEVLPGDVMRSRVRCQRLSGNGSLRLRQVLSGRMRHPELVVGGNMSDGARWSMDAGISLSGGEMRVGPIEKPQYIWNHGFETGDLSGWDYSPGNGNVDVVSGSAHSGSYRCRLMDGGLDVPFIIWHIGGGTLKHEDRIRARLWADPGGPVEKLLVMIQYVNSDNGQDEHEELRSSAGWAGGYHRWSEYWDVPSDCNVNNSVQLQIVVDAIQPATATWSIDDVIIERVIGNIAVARLRNQADAEWFNVVPGQPYKASMKVRADSGVRHGQFHYRVRCHTHLPKDDVVFESETLSREDDDFTFDEVTLEVEFTPPSGYDRATIEIVGKDIYGGSFRVDDLTCRATDETTVVYERVVRVYHNGVFSPDAPTMTTFSDDRVMPEGVETVRVEVVAEDDATWWDVDSAGLFWVCSPRSAASVMTEVVNDTPLAAGSVFSAGTIAFDWWIRNRTSRQLWDELSSSGLVQPAREWRVNHDGTVDWGLPAELYVDRTGVVLVEGESWLIDDPDAKVSRELFASDVKVIGQERRTFRGAPFTPTAKASNAVGSLEAWDGSAFSRWTVLEDSIADHEDFAAARAAQAAEDAATERLSYTLGLSNWMTLEDFDVGDWVYLYHPTEGIRDDSRPLSWRGTMVWPKRLRVLSRTWRLGDGPFQVFVRMPGSHELVEVTRWADFDAVTTAEVEVGNPRPDFLSNPQGGSVGSQYLKYRASVREP